MARSAEVACGTLHASDHSRLRARCRNDALGQKLHQLDLRMTRQEQLIESIAEKIGVRVPFHPPLSAAHAAARATACTSEPSMAGASSQPYPNKLRSI